jgi:TonB family protein
MKRFAAVLAASFSLAGAAAQTPTIEPARPVPGTHVCNRYPELSQKRNESGTAMIRYDVDKTGQLVNVAVARSSGFPLLDETAVQCVSQDWRDYPATRDGEPVVSPNHFVYVAFRLNAAPVAQQARRPVAPPPAPPAPGSPIGMYLILSAVIAALLVGIGLLIDRLRTRR